MTNVGQYWAQEPREPDRAAQEPTLPLQHLRQGLRHREQSQDPRRQGEQGLVLIYSTHTHYTYYSSGATGSFPRGGGVKEDDKSLPGVKGGGNKPVINISFGYTSLLKSSFTTPPLSPSPLPTTPLYPLLSHKCPIQVAP